MTAGDPFDLQRFVDAQDGAYDVALAELRAGRKRSHWMWFVLPQLRGLGASPTSVRYGITGLAEARAYLAHPVLGSRLRECAEALLALGTSDAHAVLGSPDDLKLRSSTTLFSVAADDVLFPAVLQQFFSGEPDPRTLELVEAELVREWWAWHRASQRTRAERVAAERGDVPHGPVSFVHDLVTAGGAPAVAVVVALLDAARDEAEVALVAAGPLEELVAGHGPLEPLRRAAEQNPRVREALAGVWTDADAPLATREWLASWR